MKQRELAIPPHFDPAKIGQVWKIPYQERAEQARAWARKHRIPPAGDDPYRICLVAVDVQNTFCIPGFELYVGGRSGTGAIDDNRRLCEFIYRHLGLITRICPTMDTHQLMQIFHSIFLVDEKGEHPAPFTLVSEEDLRNGRWKFNPLLGQTLGIDPEYGQDHLRSYARKLRESGKYDLTIWPYHAMLGGIGHALVASVEEAVFFHSVSRYSQPVFEIKGKNPLTEHYSVLGPEVLEGPNRESIAQRDIQFIDLLLRFDTVIIAGQAKSHCVAWTIADLLEDIRAKDDRLARKVYLLEDCTSPVVIPGAVDFTEQADAAFKRFAGAGMHVVRSTDPIDRWPGIKL
jgi:nicotinamidase-related amidase